jgi:hypothetical protein
VNTPGEDPAGTDAPAEVGESLRTREGDAVAPDESLRQLFSERPLWLLVALILVFFRRPLTTETFFFRDLYQLFYPKRLFLAAALKAGELPFWDPLTHGGQPYLNPANTPFYPTNLLYLMLTPVAAFNLAIILQFLLCGIAGYWLARVLRLPPAGAFVSGSVFALSGYSLSSANLLPLLLALPWLALTIIGAHLYLERGERRWLTFSCLSAAMPLLSGAAELTGMMFVTLIVWVTAFRYDKKSWRARAGCVITILAFAIGLSLIQTLPAIGMIEQSSRAAKRTYEDFSRWSVHPRRLPELVIPRFSGETGTLDDRDYWGAALESTGFPYILSIYLGIVVIALIPGALSQSGSKNRRLHWALFGLGLLGVVVSLGSSLPFFRLIWEWVPLVPIFRYPVKALLVAVLPAAMLAGTGVASLMERSGRLAVGGATAVLGLGSTCIAGGYFFSGAFRHWLATEYFLQPLGPAQQIILGRSLLHSAAVVVCAALALMLCFRRPARGVVAVAVVAVTDLFLAGIPVNSYAPRAIYAPPPAAMQVQQFLGEGRLHDEIRPLDVTLNAPTNEVLWLARAQIERLNDYTAAGFGIPVIFHSDYDGLADRRTQDLTRLLADLTWQQRIPLLEMGGVRAFIADSQVTEPGVEPVGVLATGSQPKLFLHALPSGVTAKFISRYVRVSDDRILFANLSRGWKADTLLLSGADERQPGCGEAPVKLFDRSINAARYAVDAPCRGFVYLSESPARGWTTRIDGERVETVRANHAFIAVPVAAGRHIIERTYFPPFLLLGVTGSLTSFAVLCTLHFLLRKRVPR